MTPMTTEDRRLIEAGIMPEHPPVLAANQRHDSQFRNARYHSFMVNFLKGALPVIAIVLVALFAGLSLFQSSPVENLSVDSSGISDGKLIMEAPRVKGYNSDNLPYNLNAKRAIQDLSKPDIVMLESIDAILPSADGNFADIDAKNGTYNSKKEWLSLSQDIVINRKDGTIIKLNTAEINLKAGKLVSNKPVEVTTSTSSISADGVEVFNNGEIVVFKNRIRMTVNPASESE